MAISHSSGSNKRNSIGGGRQTKTKQLRKGVEGRRKKMMTRRSKTKAERAAITFKHGSKDGGQRRKRATEVQGKGWSRRQTSSGLVAKRKTSPSRV